MKRAYFARDGKRVGVDVTYTKSTQKLEISGWYDTYCGIAPEVLSFADFLRRIGVSQKCLLRVLKQWETEGTVS